jgi:ketosteroid isomerase-like protein
VKGPNVVLVEGLYAAFARRDLPEVLRQLDPAVRLRQSAALPWGGTYEGLDGARRFFGALTSTIASTVTLERLLDAGEHVVAIGRTSGTVQATGRRFDVPFAHVWELRDGKVVGVQFCIDDPTMLAALGS